MPTHFFSYDDMVATGDVQCGKRQLARLEKAGTFPKSVAISRDRRGRVVRKAWLAEEIIERRNRIIAERNAALIAARVSAE